MTPAAAVAGMGRLHDIVRRAVTGVVALGAIACTTVAIAADAPAAHKFAAPTAAPAVASTGGGIVQVTLSLAVVLAAVFVAAWVMRRLRNAGGKFDDGAITIVAERAVGPRERVVLLQVGADRVLVGVAGGQVRALHTQYAPTSLANDGTEVEPR